MRNVYKYGSALKTEILTTNLSVGSIAIWNLGQSGVVIKGDRLFITIDPYLSNSLEDKRSGIFRRDFAPPLEPKDLKGVSVVLITHHHDDHMDLDTIRPLLEVSPSSAVVLPASHQHLILNDVPETTLYAMRGDDTVTFQDIKITSIPAAHEDYETDAQGNHFWLGYFIEINGVRVYHSGDTIVDKQLINVVGKLRPDVALLPINGRDTTRRSMGIQRGNMNYREAADFGVDIGADILLPIHYDLFESNRENPAYFVDYMFHTHRKQKFHMMTVGERFVYMK
ncbi:MBL fold metallo-hydrolase [Alicyclobacillus tolerans]|uniref:MBL fold metallo-hydrolase n=1 Tax=Alicyclobacillus tolerans TaxID=90970 RepID=UPI001F485ABA|nr:MBL fold metallo-hydrolase [Alicyclobacillus tolerans]MCF8565604.1 MBL fold metallo-hydrolase [Alicyclobacillus tolerans]